jgi:large subunit ribosomal protein L3
MSSLLGKKIGMTALFTDDGQRVPVTVMEVGPCTVVQKKTEGKEGYNAIQVGFKDIEARKVNKPRTGHFKSKGVELKRYLREIRIDSTDVENYKVGDQLTVDQFKEGHYVDIVGTSKGRGFAGVMKRHNFHGKKATHGTHETFRHGGSLGPSAWPARVFKGVKMAGQYGNARRTVQNLKIIRISPEENLIMVQGGIPGPNGGLVIINSAAKKHNF